MKVKEYYTIWINQQSKEFINSKGWALEKVVEFAEDYKNGKFLNEEVLAKKKECAFQKCTKDTCPFIHEHCITCHVTR